MKKTKNGIKMLVGAGLLLSVMFLNSCSKNMQDKSAAVQGNSVDEAVTAVPIAWWKFDSTWTETNRVLRVESIIK